MDPSPFDDLNDEGGHGHASLRMRRKRANIPALAARTGGHGRVVTGKSALNSEEVDDVVPDSDEDAVHDSEGETWHGCGCLSYIYPT